MGRMFDKALKEGFGNSVDETDEGCRIARNSFGWVDLRVQLLIDTCVTHPNSPEARETLVGPDGSCGAAIRRLV